MQININIKARTYIGPFVQPSDFSCDSALVLSYAHIPCKPDHLLPVEHCLRLKDARSCNEFGVCANDLLFRALQSVCNFLHELQRVNDPD